MSAEFRKGDRVKHTDEWLRNWHKNPKAVMAMRGTVTSNPHDKERVNVRWDGHKTGYRYHESFIERLKGGSK